MSIKNNELSNNQTIKEAFEYANNNDYKVHFIGLKQWRCSFTYESFI